MLSGYSDNKTIIILILKKANFISVLLERRIFKNMSGIFISPYSPHQLWGPPNLLSKGYRDSFLGGKGAGA
jgi:hypothetical protein